MLLGQQGNVEDALEGVRGFCDPNPTKYVDNEKGEPIVVFYWGLQPADKNNLVEIKLVEGEFMKIIDNGYEGTSRIMEYPNNVSTSKECSV
ncbi:hypothetical protein RIF29_14826 [Crotalaria pallida]|uniref:Uncharacterized protein n=1 Tax=Crotalaria pallida TaxID=3830 RepID=A0AAN9FIV0_CROPI